MVFVRPFLLNRQRQEEAQTWLRASEKATQATSLLSTDTRISLAPTVVGQIKGEIETREHDHDLMILSIQISLRHWTQKVITRPRTRSVGLHFIGRYRVWISLGVDASVGTGQDRPSAVSCRQ